MTSGLTSEQIIAEIELAWEKSNDDEGPNSYTLKELCQILGLSDSAVYKRLDVLEASGRLICTNKFVTTRATTISGQRVVRPVPAYRIVPANKEVE